MKKNLNQHIDELLHDIVLPSEDELKAETKAEKVSLALSGITHSEETKKKWSEAHKGKTISTEHSSKIVKGRKEQAKKDRLKKISKEDILKAIEIFDNHQTNIINHLNTNFRTYKKLCKDYGIESPKKSQKDKIQFAIKNQSTAVFVWNSNNGKIGEFYKEFYSVSECCRVMGLHKGHMLNAIKNNISHKGYFFQKKLDENLEISI